MRAGRLCSGCFSLLAVVAALVAAERPVLAQGSLDGHGFTVPSSNPEEPYPDHFFFINGTFESAGCRIWGFGAAPYQAVPGEAGTSFTAETTSLTEGSMSWTGQVSADGGTISGSYTWTKEGQDPMTQAWSGTAAAGPLDGQTFAITADIGNPPDDILVFQLGSFESAGCRQYAFYPVAYQATANADVSTAWTSTTYSPSQGQMAWTGTVTGTQIRGSYTWTKEGQDPSTVNFTGAVAPAP